MVDPGSFIHVLNKTGCRARDFLDVERRLTDCGVAVLERRQEVLSGFDRHVLVSEKPSRFDRENRILMYHVAVPIVYAEYDRNAPAVRCEPNIRHRADLDAGHEHAGAKFQAGDVSGSEVDFVRAAEQTHAFAELQHQRSDQRQGNRHKYAHFQFQTRLAHIRKSPLSLLPHHQ
jgi:hypothetical protein